MRSLLINPILGRRFLVRQEPLSKIGRDEPIGLKSNMFQVVSP
jgi:hypothetical protein